MGQNSTSRPRADSSVHNANSNNSSSRTGAVTRSRRLHQSMSPTLTRETLAGTSYCVRNNAPIRILLASSGMKLMYDRDTSQ